MTNNNDNNFDRGWAWVVVVSSFMLHVIQNGSTWSFGVIFVELLSHFNAGEATTSYIGSIQASLTYFSGLFVGPLGKAVGWRPMAITGGVISGIGFGLSALAPNIYVLYLTYGVLTGVGNGFMYATSMMCYHGYFDKYRSMASGISVSGSGLGLMVFALMSNYLLEHYSWRVTVSVYGGIVFMVGIISGLLIKPLNENVNERSPVCNGDMGQESGLIVAHGNIKPYGTIGEPKNKDHKDFSGLDNNDDTTFSSLSLSSSVNISTENNQNNSQRKNSESKQNSNNFKILRQTLKNIFDFSLLKNPIQCLLMTTIFTFPFGYHVTYTYSPERALWYGLSSTKAASLISVMGVSNIAIRLFTGCIGGRFPRFRFYMVGFAFLSMGLLGVMVSLFESYPMMLVFIVLYGFSLGTIPSILPVVIVDTLGVDNIEKSFGMCMATCSISFLIASPMAGLIIQKTNDINLPFEVVGIIGILGALAYFCILFLIPKYGFKSSS